jgi:hypothetical protein
MYNKGGRMKMKSIDWQMLLFVGGSMVQEMWIYYGLPRIYYFHSAQDVKGNGKNSDAA